ncbi:carboxypeptidase-like regulatory domain-containing protein [Paraflavitalea speifideaquila]|uniref:carboxypeptidase-like regulatory domain-containing protein n=1 Tax=Paraflavitalea speifideaquila TaxID=3076558 RepID=UPI0028E49952|nr:carboxypeptidase-like regulatory domain-containing protein [Paraflavitalea speifideiaquila]
MKKIIACNSSCLANDRIIVHCQLPGPKSPVTPKVITGKITNAVTNEALDGVTIQLKGKSASAVTNEQGIYSISVDNVQGSVLVFHL